MMKNLRTSVLCTCFAFLGIGSFAQEQKPVLNEPNYNKPRLFDNLPEKIAFNPANFAIISGKQAGNTVSFSFSDDAAISFEGKLLAATTKENGRVQTISIQSSNYNGANLYISKVTHPDGTVKYNGRIISHQHGDLFVLQKNSTGQYEFVKKNYYDLVNE